MAKKKKAASRKQRGKAPELFAAARNIAPGAKRIDTEEFGVDLPAVLNTIRPHLEGMTYPEVGKLANMTAGSVSNVLNGSRKPSLGMVAALAHAAGGRVVVTFEPPKKKRN